jgi:hypothetical protein
MDVTAAVLAMGVCEDGEGKEGDHTEGPDHD